VERAVDAGRNTGRRDDCAVVDESASVDDDGLRGLAAQSFDRAVERGDLLAVEQAEFRDREGTGADRQRDLGLRLSGLEPRHELRAVEKLVGVAAGNDDDVGLRRIVDRILGLKLHEPAPERGLRDGHGVDV
jgi:hypothetical protein